METFLFILVLTWGVWNYLQRGFYKKKAAIYKKHIDRMEEKSSFKWIVPHTSICYEDRKN